MLPRRVWRLLLLVAAAAVMGAAALAFSAGALRVVGSADGPGCVGHHCVYEDYSVSAAATSAPAVHDASGGAQACFHRSDCGGASVVVGSAAVMLVALPLALGMGLRSPSRSRRARRARLQVPSGTPFSLFRPPRFSF